MYEIFRSASTLPNNFTHTVVPASAFAGMITRLLLMIRFENVTIENLSLVSFEIKEGSDGTKLSDAYSKAIDFDQRGGYTFKKGDYKR